MRLWGKVVSGSLLVIAVVFLIVAITVREARAAGLACAAISVVVALVGVPLLVRAFSAFTGDEALLATGRPGQAKITGLERTGWRYNRTDPIVRFALEVELPETVYPAEVKQSVHPARLAELAPGAVVALRVDPENRFRVVIDWRELRAHATLPATQRMP